MYLLFIPFQAKVERTVHHFHFTQWPDHGVPDKIKLVSFYRKVKRTKTTLNGPLTVLSLAYKYPIICSDDHYDNTFNHLILNFNTFSLASSILHCSIYNDGPSTFNLQ
jgi:protein tyrosine phosphatase